MTTNGRRPGAVDALLMDARSYARPLVRLARATARATYNDVHRLLGTGRSVQEPLGRQWARVMRRSTRLLEALPPASGPRVLFATGYGLSDILMVVEPLLAMALRLRGASPAWLSCDGVLPACEWNRFGNHDPSPGAFGPSMTRRAALDRCRVCVQTIAESHGQLPVDHFRLAAYMQPDDRRRIDEIVDGLAFERYGAFHYRGIHVGEHAYASVMRTFHRGTIDDTPETRFVFRRYLVASMLLVDLVNRLLDEVRPDRIVSTHGIYVTHGTICEVARQRGIPVVVWGIPYRKGTILLSHNETYHRTLISDPNSEWESIDLDGPRGDIIDRYLTSRRFGTKDYVSYNPGGIDDHEKVRRELGLDPALPIVSLYTNVVWDAQLYYSCAAFPNMIDWLLETIRYFAGRPTVQLVVRIHPAEVQGLFQSAQPLDVEIGRAFPQLPPNVRVVAAESRLSSYALAEMSHASVIYGTKMGLEIAAMGTPLIIAGETFNRGKGYSYDAGTREDYFALLDRVETLPRNPPEMIDRARRYAYHFFHRKMIDLPLFTARDGFRMGGLSLTFDHLRALEPGRCAPLDLICRGILDGTTPFWYDALRDEAAHHAVA